MREELLKREPSKALTEKKVVVVETNKRKRNEKEEEEDEAEGEEEHGDEGEEEEEDEGEGEEEHGDEGEDGVEGGEGAGRDEAEEMAGVGDDSEANIVEDSNDIEETEKWRTLLQLLFIKKGKIWKIVILLLTMKKTGRRNCPFSTGSSKLGQFASCVGMDLCRTEGCLFNGCNLNGTAKYYARR
jgi:hypothetical protein